MTSSFDIAFDIETDTYKQKGGPQLLHCVEVQIPQTGEKLHFANAPGYLPLLDLRDLLPAARGLIGHNALAFDVPVIERLLGMKLDRHRVLDTLVAARLAFPNIGEQDDCDPNMPEGLRGKHSLEAWGHRVGVRKSGYGKATDWRHWEPAMSDYCEADVDATVALYRRIVAEVNDVGSPLFESAAYGLERDLTGITNRITAIGFPFDEAGCLALLADLQAARDQLADDLQREFPPRTVLTPFTPKRNNKTRGYVAGVTIQKSKLVPYNPNSPKQTVYWLKERHHWVPPVLTDAGQPSVAAAVLETLDYPEAKLLLGFKTADKRISMITGDQGWLASLQDGRMHTEYQISTITSRASHRGPNIAQVPKVLTKKVDGGTEVLHGVEGRWGWECRSLFHAPDGWWLVGADMQSLELRCLANRLAPYDNGVYAALVVAGDVHSHVQQSIGLDNREQAKRLGYAMIYGCGDGKAGTIVLPDEADGDVLRYIGHEVKQGFFDAIPGFADLRQAMDNDDLTVVTLDDRTLVARKKHSKLNTQLQGDGAILCKQWLLLIDEALQAMGLRPGEAGDYEFVGWIHDEQIAIARTREVADKIAAACEAAAAKAGEYYGLACPLSATARIGHRWSEVH